jgi:hypothetical protein
MLLNSLETDRGHRNARSAANFILAWWNAESLGAFDIADQFALDQTIARDMATVFSWLASRSNAAYPEEYRTEIEAIIEAWRPEVWGRSMQRA